MNTQDESTIYALATGLGSAIGILRISGSQSHELLRKLFFCKNGQAIKKFRSGKMYYGFIHDPNNHALIDEVFTVFWQHPHSYTTEDMAEIHCHGSKGVISQIYRTLQNLGARPATAGEFSKRAFYHGRISLNQAEAIHDLVEAETEELAQIAINSLKGGLHEVIDKLREDLIIIIANLELSIDYPEEDLEIWNLNTLYQKVSEIQTQISTLAKSYDSYKLCRNGILTAIIGSPNVGKSSLLNSLLKEKRAMVTPIAGTTRDHLEEAFLLKGHKFRLVDTAGICQSHNPIEKIGIEKSLELEKEATIKLYVYDGTQPVVLRTEHNSCSCLHLINKTDLPLHNSAQKLQQEKSSQVFFISALRYEGFMPFLDALAEIATHCTNKTTETLIISQRQQLCLQEAHHSLQDFTTALQNGIPLDIALIDLYRARDQLAQITGKIYTEDILDYIFANFCLGK